MAENNSIDKNLFNNDSFDINELASLNEDISPEFIEQLQNQVSQNLNKASDSAEEIDDSQLFEEIKREEELIENNSQLEENFQKQEKKQVINIDDNIDDNFIKKYKARLNQQEALKSKTDETEDDSSPVNQNATENDTIDYDRKERGQYAVTKNQDSTSSEIENLTSGNIVEKPITQEQVDYNNSLDFLDNNIKYSKYVIYIDPENTEFIESLTVKERKNLINKIIKEQCSVAITKKKLNTFKTIVKHLVLSAIVVTLFIPVFYYIINLSLEATINNHRQAKSMFQILYREHGKIRQIN